ncbi:winged helix-turn-helix transcriptional regulator [Ruegeria sp. 2012CJ41-6]|uniref:Winged helix-turn-helix transcriptional regulator n=1 Tax=Ruegeria spongiae TaxID=2942209 RepID=A0ABT0Q3Q0_9RHOB|nr:winged helix-turn-helix transcriptional regulator [Ruegeria spongiae]MCL6284500.1 winged helix-turn-helix transcriptional regulator [Ruegeria spongiae]
MDINLLVKITSRAWSLSILALLHDGVPGRQAPLLTQTGAGRTAFAQSLAHLKALGLLERNPGHGHPLRPEFRLTQEGIAIAETASRIRAMVPGQEERALLRRAWSVPILAVGHRPRYFSEMKGALMPITDRALAQSLQHLRSHQWMDREIDISRHPPRPLYQTVNAGAAISQIIGLTLAAP